MWRGRPRPRKGKKQNHRLLKNYRSQSNWEGREFIRVGKA